MAVDGIEGRTASSVLAPTAGWRAAGSLHRSALLESVGLSLAGLLLVGAGIFGLWVTSTRSIRENYHHYLIGLAQAAATLVDPALHASLRRADQRNDADYARAVEPLRRMRRSVADVHYIYTVERAGTAVHFVLDTADPGARTAGGIDDQAGVWEVYGHSDPAMQQALGSQAAPGVPAATDRSYGDQWGTFMTGWAPLRDASGRQYGAVGVDVDASVYLARLANARFWALGGLLPAGLLILALGAGIYRLRARSLTQTQAALEHAAASAQSARALAAERARFAAVIEGTGVGIWEWDLDSGAVTVSDRWAAMIGGQAADFAGLTVDAWQALVHPDDRAGLAQALQAARTSGGLMLLHEFRMRHAEGHWLWVVARGKVLESDPDHRPLRVAGIQVDVTERKVADLSLRESELRFRSLFELSPVGMALNDLATGQFLQVNDAMLGPTGYTREELLGMTYWDITPPGYVDHERVQIDALERFDRYGPYEKEYQRKDGSTYPVLLSGIRMRDSSGRAVIWSLVQDISQRKAMESALVESTRRDKLTGLANRALFMDCLQQALARVHSGEQPLFAVLFLDCDRFKLINDTQGHKAGDELLQQIARRLRGALRAADIMAAEGTGNLVSRFGGDEFLILLNDLKAPGDAALVAERLLNALAPPHHIFGSEVHATASIGIVTSDRCNTSAEDIVRNADVAMYEAKHSGGACSVVFNEAMHTRLTRHVAIEADLRRAIGTSELSLVYQPIIELNSGRMVSAEALVRWHHPTLGLISPAEFVPIAEESGLIVVLGQWVLKEACRALVAWRQADPQRAPGAVSVNISRAELALGMRLLERVRMTLAEVGLPPQRLQLEVTEREVMRNPETSLELMQSLRRLGVRLAMDDFGTGTSSLAFLREYPFDVIKIDRSFVKDLTASADVLAVIHATINLVENLGMVSLAEGVEQFAQVSVLQSLGCRYAQGFLFSRPVPAAELIGAVEATSADTRTLPTLAAS